jgi:Ca2+-binding RTX toxin-like protein
VGSGTVCYYVDNTTDVYPDQPFTSWIQCDADLACGSGESITAYMVRHTDTSVSPSNDIWVAWGECSGSETFCCEFDEGTDDDSNTAPRAAGIKGTDEDDTLSLYYVDGSAQYNMSFQSVSLTGRLYGLDGNDIITGSDTNNAGSYLDQLRGGDGCDYLIGRKGNDTLFGDGGEDFLKGDAHEDILRGGDEDDVLAGYLGEDDLYGEDHDDKLCANTQSNTLTGTDLSGICGTSTFTDAFTCSAGSETTSNNLYGGLGDDKLYGAEGADRLFGGGENDESYGEAGNDTICDMSGTGGTLEGGDQNDVVVYDGTGSPTIDCGDGTSDDGYPSGTDCETILTQVPAECQ